MKLLSKPGLRDPDPRHRPKPGPRGSLRVLRRAGPWRSAPIPWPAPTCWTRSSGRALTTRAGPPTSPSRSWRRTTALPRRSPRDTASGCRSTGARGRALRGDVRGGLRAARQRGKRGVLQATQPGGVSAGRSPGGHALHRARLPRQAGMNTMRTPCDYLIVGAGSAGCVLAARLSESPDVSVVLLEAGGSDRSPLIAMPMGEAHLIGSPLRLVLRNRARGTHRRLPLRDAAGPGPRRVPLPSTVRSTRGGIRETTTSGGSSDAKGGPSRRSSPASGGPNAGRGAGTATGAARDRSRPRGGASSTRSTTPFSRQGSRSATDGARTTTARSRKASHGSSTPTPTARSAAAPAPRAYLRPARRRPNLKVLTGARATRILLERNARSGSSTCCAANAAS